MTFGCQWVGCPRRGFIGGECRTLSLSSSSGGTLSCKHGKLCIAAGHPSIRVSLTNLLTAGEGISPVKSSTICRGGGKESGKLDEETSSGATRGVGVGTTEGGRLSKYSANKY